jgi:hypothetical protein
MSVVTVLNRNITLQVLRRPTRGEWPELVHDVEADMIASSNTTNVPPSLLPTDGRRATREGVAFC